MTLKIAEFNNAMKVIELFADHPELGLEQDVLIEAKRIVLAYLIGCK